MLPLYDPHYTYAYGGVLVFDRGAVLVYLLSEYLEEIVIIKMYMRDAYCLAVLGKFTVPCDQNHAILFCIITHGGITLDICSLIRAVLSRCTHRVPNTVVCRTICQASGLRGSSWLYWDCLGYYSTAQSISHTTIMCAEFLSVSTA